MALYPPLLEAYQPAFSYQQKSLRIYFKPPTTVNMVNIKHLCIKLSYQSNNSIVPLVGAQKDGLYYYFPENGWVNENNSDTYYVDISPAEGWKEDCYYKLQMRFGTAEKFEEKNYIEWRQSCVANRRFSEWSTVMVLKAIMLPKVEIINQKKDLAMYLLHLSAHYTELTSTPLFYGEYSGSNEPLDRYRFQLYKVTEEGNTLIEDSDWQQYYSSDQGEDSTSIINIWRFKTGLEEAIRPASEVFYQVIYSIKTVNKYEFSADPYIFHVDTSYLKEIEDLQLIVSPNVEEGCVEIGITDISWNGDPIGNYIITRTDERSNFQNWEDLHYFSLASKQDDAYHELHHVFTDYTIESGIKYKYKIWTVNSKGLRTRWREMGMSSSVKLIEGDTSKLKIEKRDNVFLNAGTYNIYYVDNRYAYNQPGSNYWCYLEKTDFEMLTGVSASSDTEFTIEIILKENEEDFIKVDFEHAYLYHNGVQLKLEYNLKLSSFKKTVLANKQDTLGSKYPTIMRNGYVDYAEFPLAGLISIHMDDARTFLKQKIDDNGNNLGLWYKDELVVPPDRYQLEGTRSKTAETASALNASIPFGLTADGVFIEKRFREKVIEFLNDGDYKLFKSPTEGNFIVSLVNVSFTPNAQLGRMIFDFSATAYEVAENTLDNLITYGLEEPGTYDDTLLKEPEGFFGQIRLEDLYSFTNLNWITSKDESNVYNLITDYTYEDIKFDGNIVQSIMNIEETNKDEAQEYRYNVDEIVSLEVEPYPMVDLDKWIKSLIIELNNTVPDFSEMKTSWEKLNAREQQYYTQEANEKRKVILRKIAIYEHFKNNWVYNNPISLTINNSTVFVGPAKKYIYKGKLTKGDSIKLNIPALVNYVCHKSVIEDTKEVVISSFQGEDWGQWNTIVEAEAPINVYDEIKKDVESNIIEVIKKSENYSEFSFDTLVKEDGEFWNTDSSKKWRYRLQDYVLLRIEAAPGTIIEIKNKETALSPSTTSQIMIGSTGIYNVRDYGSTNFEIEDIKILNPYIGDKIIVDYRVIMSIKEMDRARVEGV